MDIGEILTVGIGVGLPMLIVSFFLFNVYLKRAFKANVHTQQLEAIFKQLNIKDFKVTDLNTGKLDDLGFNRLLTLITALYQQKQSPGAGLGQLGQIMQQLGALSQFNQIAGGGRGQTSSQGGGGYVP